MKNDKVKEDYKWNRSVEGIEGMVSILVPCYNMELYIPKCLESLLGQTYDNLEIIVVDNASTDSSLRILEEYQKKDDRVRIIEKKKMSTVGRSRNMALEASRGEYIWYVDSDDYAEPNYLEIMLKRMKEAEVDIVQCCYTTFDDFGNEADTLPYKKDQIYSGRDLCIFMNDFVGLSGPQTMLWNKLYKRRVLENLHFYEGRAYEDMFFTYKVFYDQEKILWIADRLMHWRKNVSSGTSKYNYREFYLDEIMAYIERLRYFKEKSDEELYRLILKRLYYTSAQHLYLYTTFVEDEVKVRKQSWWLRSIINQVYPELRKLNWPLRTRLRMKFIRLFPKAFGRASVHHKLDFTK